MDSSIYGFGEDVDNYKRGFQTRKGGDDILRNPAFIFIENELPFVGKFTRRIVKILQKPPKRQIKIIVLVVLVSCVLISLLPLNFVNYINGVHWTKGVPLMMSLPPVRKCLDYFYLLLIRKLKLIYMMGKFMLMIMLFPFILFLSAFANLSRIRVMIILCFAQVLISQLLSLIIRNGGNDATGTIAYTNKMVKMEVVRSSISFALFIGLAVYLYKRHPMLYQFCFDTIDVRTLAMLMLAIAIYIQVSIIMYVDSATAGRITNGGSAPSKQALRKKTNETTVIVTFACVVGLYLTMAMNPGYFSKLMLIEPDGIVLE